MKTFAELKRRLTIGTKLRVLEHNYRPELTGTVRTIVKVQTNGYWFDSGDGKRAWSEYGKAAYYSFPNENTYMHDAGNAANGKRICWTLEIL